ncbi:MAG: glycoside hydrolase family 57 protein [Sulfolobales archaeon]|nr:glycoside hydrolase family 57 protein [Sulfolobales archaeon]MCX8185943.1 glycoside hydrolase family 57 protein [Sulfolobales archaeon]MDW7969200.1 glycoside hydrolase family 57 protein [Sulfolobales archaeon]
MVKYIFILFEVHQPRRLRGGLTEGLIRNNSDHGCLYNLLFDERRNEDILKKVSSNCYIPTTKLLLDNLREYRGNIKINFSFSGIVLEQFMKYFPDALELFKDLIRLELADVVVEPYYHSLVSVYEDHGEFISQINEQIHLVKELFEVTPKAFVNTELIYNNLIANTVKEMGFDVVVTEGVDRVLNGRNPNHVYLGGSSGIKLLLRNYRLSDDVAFRFSNKSWDQYPLFADRYVDWIIRSPGDLAVIAMDYETFGEHHRADTGIFDFLKHFINYLGKNGVSALGASEVGKAFDPVDIYDVPSDSTISWADVEKDLSAWLGDREQIAVFNRHKSLLQLIGELGIDLLKIWRYLSTSDHYYYISSKGGASGEVHRYFSPHGSRTNAYCLLNNALTILELRILGYLNSR